MILIVGPNASSQYGGEAFLPLKYFQVLRRRGYPARLIAHTRNKDDLTAFLGDDIEHVDFVRDSIWHRSIWAVAKRMPSRLRVNTATPLLNWVNEYFQAKIIRERIASDDVTLIHQPTPVSPKSHSAIYGFGVPVVIGPMNGAMTFPKGYENYESLASRWLIKTVSKIALGMNWLVPGKRKAAALLVANDRTRAALPCPDHPNIQTLVENGVDFEVWSHPQKRAEERAGNDTFRLVFMGRLVDWKAVDITLDALALARASGVDVVLEILGDGPDREMLEAYTAEKGLSDAVTFAGFLPQNECADRLAASHALILNSLWECGGAVVLEAMAMQLPVIASDWGGPADYLDDTCGILVPPSPRGDFANRLADAISKLSRDPDLCKSMGQAGFRKVREQYDWEKKVDRILEIYSAVEAAPISDTKPVKAP